MCHWHSQQEKEGRPAGSSLFIYLRGLYLRASPIHPRGMSARGTQASSLQA